jgi:hypothetical protein
LHAVPTPRKDDRCALHESTSRPATWFEFVEDTELIAFKQSLLAAFSQSVAVGEIVGGSRAGTLVMIPIRAPGNPDAQRFTSDETVNAFVAD